MYIMFILPYVFIFANVLIDASNYGIVWYRLQSCCRLQALFCPVRNDVHRQSIRILRFGHERHVQCYCMELCRPSATRVLSAPKGWVANVRWASQLPRWERKYYANHNLEVVVFSVEIRELKPRLNGNMIWTGTQTTILTSPCLTCAFYLCSQTSACTWTPY